METIIFLIIAIAILGLLSYGISKLIFYLMSKIFILGHQISFNAVFTTTTVAISVLSILTVFHLLTFHDAKLSAPINSYDRQLDKLVKGKMAFDIPDTMEVKQNYKATVSITKAMNDSILFQGINRIHFREEEIKISSRVKVLLIDPTGNQNFRITPINTEEQLVDDSTNTIWKWNIIPIKGGDNDLVLRATVKILDNLGENYKDISVFEKTIKVNTSVVETTKQFISEYWQWLTTVCVIPLLIWGYKSYSGRKKNNTKSNPIGFKRNDKNDKSSDVTLDKKQNGS
jgi:hypothetical protein